MRTKNEIFGTLKKLAHSLFTATPGGRAILAALSLLLAAAEKAWEEEGGWLDQTFRQRASGFWLEQHVKRAGERRQRRESDEKLRPRGVLRSRVYTVAEAQRDQDDALALQGEGYRVKLIEPLAACLGAGLFLDTPQALLMPGGGRSPGRVAEIRYPVPEVTRPPVSAVLGVSAILDALAYLGESATDPDRPFLRDAKARALARKPVGVAYGFRVVDDAQDAHLISLFFAE